MDSQDKKSGFFFVNGIDIVQEIEETKANLSEVNKKIEAIASFLFTPDQWEERKKHFGIADPPSKEHSHDPLSNTN